MASLLVKNALVLVTMDETRREIPGGALLIGAYAIVWVLLFLFLARLRRLQSQTAEELERLSAEMKASGDR